MSNALYPFMAEQFGGEHEQIALGLLYASAGIGSVLASVTSGWTAHVHRHGLAVIVAALLWGAAVAVGLGDAQHLADDRLPRPWRAGRT